ncbi:class I SAM-dependent methyltransferase [Amycolatopsis sp. NPDC102389]|uniref:class I SAM-dependent methyltransferase n=1 Tax=Amycolatopsis sp. NPDC102389 TaxID=3363941 RepID=UPI00381F3D59
MSSVFETREAERLKKWDRYWRELPPGEGVAVWDTPAASNVGTHMSWMEPYFEKSLPVLDIGCGNGTQTAHLTGKYERVLGLEISESAVEAASETHRHPGLEFRQFDILSDPATATLHDELGDCNIYVRTLLHVFPKDEQLAAAANLARLLGSTGHILILEMPHSAGPVFEAGLNQSEDSLPKVRRNISYDVIGANLADGEIAEILDKAGIETVEHGTTLMPSTDRLSDGTALEIPLEYVLGRNRP